MQFVLADKAEEYTKIKATLGQEARRVTTRHEILTEMDKHPDCRVLVVAPGIKSELAFALAAELRVQSPLLGVVLLRNRIDMATLSSAIEAGIRDVIDAQDAAALMGAVRRCETISEQISARQKIGESSSRRGRIVTVYSAKGGSGKTTISSNLAAALADQPEVSVCLVDLDLQFGDIATALRTEPIRTIADALEMNETVDADGLAKVLVNYGSNLDLLLAPTDPSQSELISPDFISRVLAALQQRYDYVVVDTSPNFNDVIRQTLQESDLALLVTTLDMPAIKNLRLAISVLDGIGFSHNRRRVLLNRADAKVGLEASDVAELVGESIMLAIPSSPKVAATTNEGRLIVQAHPHNSVSRAIFQLAEEVRSIAELPLEAEVA